MKKLKYFLCTTGVLAFAYMYLQCGGLESNSISLERAVVTCSISTVYIVTVFIIYKCISQDDYN